MTEKLKALRRVESLNHANRERWRAVYGRIETKLPRKVGDFVTEGFGHLSGSPAQMIGIRYLFVR